LKEPRILIAENSPSVRFVLERTLRSEKYSIDLAANGEEAIALIHHNVYDLILLDLHMEPVDGMQVLNVLRKESIDTVVIILTAHGSMESAVEALRLETFDYLLKPATPDMIRKRVRDGLVRRQELLRHRQMAAQIDTIKIALQKLEDVESHDIPNDDGRFEHHGKVLIDRHHREIILADQKLGLTSAEFNILSYLIEAAPAVISPSQLVKATLGYEVQNSEASEIIKVYIHHLRQKIEAITANDGYIKTIRHQGYLWCK
jgi:DNA-binding response OmpR family regulator